MARERAVNRRKKTRNLVTRVIVYRDARDPAGRQREIRVDIRDGEILDVDYAAGMVAVRTGIALRDVEIIEVSGW